VIEEQKEEKFFVELLENGDHEKRKKNKLTQEAKPEQAETKE